MNKEREKINTSVLLQLCNAPVNWSADCERFLWQKEMTEVRLYYKKIDDTHIELSKGNGFYWGLAFDWGEENYKKDFLKTMKCNSVIFETDDFLEKQNSILRIQDDLKLQKEIIEEQKIDSGVWNKGFSSTLAYGVFRGIINKSYKHCGIFQRGILKAIDMAYYPFLNWRGWTDKKRTYYDMSQKEQKLGDIVRGEAIRKIYHWMCSQYEPQFVEECFNKALGKETAIKALNGWRHRLDLLDLDYQKAICKTRRPDGET